jgi:hypothetical protein
MTHRINWDKSSTRRHFAKEASRNYVALPKPDTHKYLYPHKKRSQKGKQRKSRKPVTLPRVKIPHSYED